MRFVPIILVALVVLSPLQTAVAVAHDGHNEPPLVDAGLDRDVPVGERVLLDAGGSIDPDGELASFNWVIETPSGATTTPTDPSAEQTSFTPQQVGRYEVTLTATDDHGATRRDTLYVDVAESATGDTREPNDTAENQPPTGTIDGPNTVRPNREATFSVDAYDPDGSVVSYAWSDGAQSRTVRRTIDAPAGSSLTISVTVTDDDGATTTIQKQVSVRTEVAPADGDQPNSPPTASITGPARVAAGDTATFILHGADTDGTIVNAEWTAPTHGTAVLKRTFDTPGTRTLRGVVTDDEGATAEAATTVEVYQDGPPIATLTGPDTAQNGTVHRYGLTARDPDGGELTVVWNPSQSQLERDYSPFTNNVRIDGGLGGTVQVSATVIDDEGERTTVLKRTGVMTQYKPERWHTVPVISDFRAAYIIDDPKQDSQSDTIQLGTYSFSADIKHGEDKLVRAVWEINDSTTITQNLGRFNGTKSTSIQHQFLGAEGGPITRSVEVTAIDTDGNRTTERWVSRVRSVVSGTNVTFNAISATGETATGGDRLSVNPGWVDFRVWSLQHFRVEFGDGEMIQSQGSPNILEFQHEFAKGGEYTVLLTSYQEGPGYAFQRILVDVTPQSYREYWYEMRSGTTQRIISSSPPEGKDWSKVRIDHSEQYLTGETLTVETHRRIPRFVGDDWVENRTYSKQMTRKRFETARMDPDGSGDLWTLSESRVDQKTVVSYEDEYKWVEAQFGIPGWESTGETRSQRIVHGDGHTHRPTRHEKTKRTSCRSWAMDASRFRSPRPVCTAWNHYTEVWYTGHEHNGWTEHDVDYRYHREVKHTDTVWLNRYEKSVKQTVLVTEYAETASRNYWLWERPFGGPSTQHSLKRPADGSYLPGSLRIVEVKCGTDESHFDHVKC
ncbi:PKD domain-containing protein [Halobaculum sp. D14]|uniref:PKD domain-containing protein n=1 Tax=Halobaculum sp. D14 TaxID=3421642 RepID=UPI003EC06FEC